MTCECNHDENQNNGDQTYTRRIFLQQGLTLASLAGAVPLFVQNSAFGFMRPLGSQTTSQPGVPEDRVLVVVQLGGGNDGLNTVVPYGDPTYYRARPGLAIPAPGQNGNGRDPALQFEQNAGIGLHPSMGDFKELVDDGVAAVYQGVGYPNPNRSHFASMDIWHTGDTSGTGTGWLGRYFDNTCNGTPDPQGAIAIGRTAPLALVGETQKPVAFESAELFRWLGEDISEPMADTYHHLNRPPADADAGGNDQLAFLAKTALDAQITSDRIRKAMEKRPLVSYPGGSLSNQLQIVGAMIRDELPTRVYYVNLGGFDTHANQFGNHARLLQQLSASLNAFYKDLKAQGNSSRVLTMVFSEFGRRVSQNGGGGTDHGTAAPMYFIGDMLRPGLFGNHPSLTDLDQGDLKFNLDFRCLYASVIHDWMGANDVDVLSGRFRRAKLLR